MQPARKLQSIIIAFSILLVALIFYLGKNNPTALAPGADGDSNADTPAETIEATVNNEEGYERPPQDDFFIEVIDEEKEQLSNRQKTKMDSLYEAMDESPEDSAEHLRALAEMADQGGLRKLTGYYYEQLAHLLDTEEAWHEAANNYFQAQKVANDTKVFNLFVERSINCFNKVLEHNPENLNAKADLAVAYFESDKDRVRGIGMLREIYEVNPEHEKTLYYLGMINMRSGEYDLARQRLERLTELQPGNAFNHYYLGQVYLNEGLYEKALASIKEYRSKVQDPALRQQANQLIEKIENSL